MHNRRRTLVNTAITAGCLLALATPAWAASPTVKTTPTETSVSGSCTKGSRALLTLSHDDGHVEAEMELHTRKAGQVWKLRFHNEQTPTSWITRTAGHEGSGGTLSVSRLLANHAGTDTITASAVNMTTGERCKLTRTL